ncbi:Zinc metalloproteinase-disintegrin-like cobrin [Hondaea fermentalgiana]|uniref:Zinc metalloproteinase-disintegrin-like cobrin n=1 Tax=Hondaea fermentalgiana TaxID=2315210 RepID=A0A2R5G7B3_9STRA|nr:Zinc metalloproteinase-disintegrin-like cobrin [Hondaea fermentalgiana]|eukprot:GBG23931.1 Zinc metalloproteinase-disintegrin-like cobrin [Hondaea fermentalgiana]
MMKTWAVIATIAWAAIGARGSGAELVGDDVHQQWFETLLEVEHVSFDVHESGAHGMVRVAFWDEHGKKEEMEKKVVRVKGLYAPDATVEDSDGTLGMHEHNDAKYTFHATEHGQTVVVGCDPGEDGHLSVSLFRRGGGSDSLIEIKHYSEVVQEMGEDRFRNLRQADEVAADAYFGLVHDLHQPPRGREEPDEDEEMGDTDADFVVDEETDFGWTSSHERGPARALADVFELRDINNDPFRDELAYFPFCYPFDTRRQVIDIGLATSRATWENEGKSAERVQKKFEEIVVKVNVIMAAQLNFWLRIRKVMIAANKVPSSWHEIFHFSKEKGTCPDPPKGIREAMFKFAPTIPLEDNVGSWTYIHGCPSNGNGFGQSGSLCRLPHKGGSSCQSKSLSFRVVSHEMGHTIAGMPHTMENGVRNTGGLMDYGSGRIRGTKRYAYNLLGRERSCYRTNNAFARIPQCPYWRNATGDLACGDRFLLPEEECECEDGSTSCTGCVMCRLQDTSRQCSTKTFFMHPKYATEPIVEGGSFSSPECCTAAGVLGTVSDTCTMPDGEKGRCSLGRCVNPCAVFGMTRCGEQNNGCLQKCKPRGETCEANYYKKNTDHYAGEIDNGSKCARDNGAEGNEVGTCARSAADAIPDDTASDAVSYGTTHRPARSDTPPYQVTNYAKTDQIATDIKANQGAHTVSHQGAHFKVRHCL